MARSENPLSRVAIVARWIELDVHQFIHILEHEHVAVQLHNSLVLNQRKWREFAPAIIESRIIAKILFN